MLVRTIGEQSKDPKSSYFIRRMTIFIFSFEYISMILFGHKFVGPKFVLFKTNGISNQTKPEILVFFVLNAPSLTVRVLRIYFFLQ